MTPLTQNEERIVEALRSLKPHEFIQITADVQGRPDSFLVHRSTKVLLIAYSQPLFVKQ